MKILDNLCRLYWGEQHRCTTWNRLIKK